MSTHQRVSLGVMLAMLVCGLASAQTSTSAFPPPTQHDGQHDFDWIIGSWKIYVKRIDHPLSGNKVWLEYEGSDTVRKVWDGRANLDEFDAESKTTHEHLTGLTLRLYDPKTHQWSLYWANAKNGALAMPPTVGHFTDGRGEFYDEEVIENTKVLVRYIWSEITPSSAHFEQAFSTDGGKTWAPNWISTITRVTATH